MTQNTEKTLGERIQEKWSKLSPGDVKAIGSDMSILASKVSTVYNRSKEDAEKEIAEFKKRSRTSNLLYQYRHAHIARYRLPPKGFDSFARVVQESPQHNNWCCGLFDSRTIDLIYPKSFWRAVSHIERTAGLVSFLSAESAKNFCVKLFARPMI